MPQEIGKRRCKGQARGEDFEGVLWWGVKKGVAAYPKFKPRFVELTKF